MSFMKGFGDGFADAFEAENKRQEARRQDEIDKQWDLYKDNLKEIQARDKANRQDWKFAETVAADNQLPASAAGKIYEWKQMGFSIPQIQEMIQEGEFVQSRSGNQVQTEYVDPRDAETQAATGQQPIQAAAPSAPKEPDPTKTSSTAPALAEAPLAPAAPTANKRNNDFFGNVSSRFANIRERRDERRKDRATTAAAKMAGVSPEEFRSVVTNPDAGVFTPPVSSEASSIQYIRKAKPEAILDLADAKFNMEEAIARGDKKAAERFKGMIDAQMFEIAAKASKEGAGNMYYVRDKEGKLKLTTGELSTSPDGKSVVQSIDGNQYETVTKMPEYHERLFQKLADGNPAAVKYQNKQAAMSGVVNQSGRLFEILDKNPIVATTTGGETSRIISIIDAEIEGAKELFRRVAGTPKAAETALSLEKKLHEKVNENGGIKTIAEARSLANAYIDILSFNIGRAEGQEGQSLSNADAEKFKNAISAASDADKIKLLVSTYVTNKVEELNQESKNFNEFNVEIETIRQLTGGFTPVEKIVPTFDEYIAGTENEQFYQMMKERADGFRRSSPEEAKNLGAGEEEPQTNPYAPPTGKVISNSKIYDPAVNGSWADFYKSLQPGEVYWHPGTKEYKTR